MTAGATEGSVQGWRAVTLSSGVIDVVILPEKGAEVHAFVDREAGVDVLFHAPWGLQPPGSPPREGWDSHPFLANYAGGWQELLPNANEPCEVAGRRHPFHGDVATLPWSARPWESGSAAGVDLQVDCVTLPLQVSRRMTVESGLSQLTIEEQVTNIGTEGHAFVWGHHVVLGPPLIAEGAEIVIDAEWFETAAQPWEATARIEPGQVGSWPYARCCDASTTDLTRIPGPQTGSHDDMFVSGLASGRAGVWNAQMGLGFTLEFDASLFPVICLWQPYGGAIEMPLTGTYGLGLEPWSCGGNVASAVERNQALWLDPGESVSTVLIAEITRLSPTTGAS